MRGVLSVFLCACLAWGSSASAWEKPGFPRLGGYKIGTPQAYEDPQVQRDYGRLDLVILNTYPGWEEAHHATLQSAVQSIKSNKGTLVFEYLNINELSPRVGGAFEPLRGKVESEHWWLYPQGTSGAPVASTWANFQIVNYTLGARANASGERYVDWYSKWAFNRLLRPAPALDGTYTDNFFWVPRVNGDWDRDGVSDGKKSSTAQQLHRQGMRRHIEVLKTLMPGKLYLGNLADWGQPNAVYPEYEGLLNGGVLERYIGETWSPEGQDWKGATNNWGSWAEMMREYRKVMKSVAEPKLVIFNQFGDPTNYQSFRYGLASCLMDDAYFDFTDARNGMYSTVPWFDEYDAKLGQASSGPALTAWKSGVYRRNFENGIALVNPRGNGTVTVDLEKDFMRINGTQDRAVNNGQLTRKVTLQDRDGIILLDPNATDLPQPPKNFEAR